MTAEDVRFRWMLVGGHKPPLQGMLRHRQTDMLCL